MANPRITGFLARGVSQEMGAIQQHLAQAHLVDLWGWSEVAEAERAAMAAARARCERLMGRMFHHGVAPNATQLPAVRLGRSCSEILRVHWRMAQDAARLYEEASTACARQRAMDDSALFRTLLDQHLVWRQQVESELSALERKR